MKTLITFLSLVVLVVSCKKDEPTPTLNKTSHLNSNLTYGVVTDVDGNEYATIQIGAQVWMAENLRTTKYCNGDLIPNITDNTQWIDLTTGAWAHYDNDSKNEVPYGKLYNWYAVNDFRNICPCNWHVPTDAEWSVLMHYLGNQGGKMKSTGTQYWQSPNTDATNESGFSGLPGGYRDGGGSFSYIGGVGYWWGSTESSPITAWPRLLSFDSGEAFRFNYVKRSGFSVRCLRD